MHNIFNVAKGQADIFSLAEGTCSNGDKTKQNVLHDYAVCGFQKICWSFDEHTYVANVFRLHMRHGRAITDKTLKSGN